MKPTTPIFTGVASYQRIATQIDDRDAEIFISIPCILVLMGIDNEDKGLCYFCPDLLKEGTEWHKVLQELKGILGGQKISDHHDLYNVIEKEILGIDISSDKEKELMEQEKSKVDNILQKVKWVAMQLSRHDPTEWNLFIDVSLYS